MCGNFAMFGHDSFYTGSKINDEDHEHLSLI